MDADRLYLDHAAATPVDPDALALWVELAGRPLANPSSPHAEGRLWKDVLEEARTRAAAAFGCRPRELMFTGGGTDAARIAVQGLAFGRRDVSSRIVVSALEHPAVLDAARALTPLGFDVIEVAPQRDGVVRVEDMLAAVGEGAAFAALMLANHEAATAQPVAELATALRERAVPLLVDAALAPGRLPCSSADLGADVTFFSGAKFGGAPGAGLLYVRRGTPVRPAAGGGLQEERLRPGTESVAAWAATALAFENKVGDPAARGVHADSLITAFVDGLATDLEWASVGDGAERVPGMLTIELPGVEGEAVMINMDLRGVAVATGSTCTLGSADPSPGLLAMGFTRARAASTIRISVNEGLDTSSMKRAATILSDVVLQLRALSRR